MKSRLYHCVHVLLCSVLLLLSAKASNPPPTQVFYIPFPEDNQLAGFLSVTTGNGNTQAANPLAVFVTFSAATDNTVIYYDHWEDGYEKDITRPAQSTTLVFGNGNPADGYPPGNAGDLIPAGTVFSLRNYVTSTTLQSVLDYDARDKVASFKPISLTKTSFPAATNTLLAGCIEVFEQGLWGTEYRVPVGVNMPTSTATSTLTTDADIFSYTSLSIMAGAKGATVQIDADNNGSFEQTVALSEGQTTYVTGVNAGGKVVSNNPVQVILFSGRIGSDWMSRDTSLLPTYRWGSSYYAPVSTSATYGTTVFLYNPGASAITVNYDYRSSASAYTTASVNVPAGGNARVNLSPANGTNHFGAYHFYTSGATPPVFYALCAVDATNATAVNNNRTYDGGFTLVGQPSLTTQVLVSLGIGRDPYSSTNPTENGNPVWLTTVGNGHTPETIYVDYDGDNAGPLTDPNGNHYDIAYSLRELQQQKIFDPDGDQSGMLAYSLNPSVKIASAWAQDPAVAAVQQPGLDVSTLLPPLREGEAGKKSDLSVDADGDGHVSAGDTLEYDIRATNSARAGIPGPFAVQDNLPSDVTYVAGSTRYRYSVGGNWQAWMGIPDDGSGTPFPLDGSGFSVPGNLGVGQQLQVVFKAVIKNYAALSGPTITNSGFVEISPYGLVLPIEWKDIIYGSIGDRVWNDLDGDGIQEGGEAGIAGIDVFADLNNNGIWDSDEPKDTTDGNGDYLIAGLPAGNYTLRVDPADVAAVNVGYGPSYDLDGVATSYAATVALAGAQDRVDADFGFRVGASVGDRVWMDRDADDTQDAGEPGINGVRVYIDLDNDNAYDVGEPNTISSSDGTYYIGNLEPGTYTVRVDTSTLSAGASQTYDFSGVQNDHEASVTLIAAEHVGTVDFGYRGTLSIGDLVWNDVNADGTNTSESGIANVKVYIDANANGVRDATEAFATTNASGVYSITNLFNGTYTVRVDTTTLPASFVQTFDPSSPTNDHTAFVTLSGSNRTDVDFGYRNDATIGDLVWNDRNANGARDAGEPGIEGVMVYIDADGDNLFDQGVERYAITDVAGYYQIDNLAAGTYAVRVEISTLPQGSTQTFDLGGAQNDHEASRVLTVSENAVNVDFGYRASAGFSDLIWNDSDADRIKDAGESGIANVRVYVDLNGDGAFDSATEPSDLSDSLGIYSIDNLVPGTYTARVDTTTLPAGMSQTFDAVGTLDHAATFFISATQTRTDIDFGYTAPVTIGDFVWADNNANGQYDVGEPGLTGVSVTVYNAANDTVAGTTTTGPGGLYSFPNLLPGTYYIVFDSLPGYNRTPANQGADTSDSDADISTGSTANVTLTGGQGNLTLDAGYYQPGTVTGHLYIDTNGNGTQDSGEPDLANVDVIVSDAFGNQQTVSTGPTGNWTATVPPGSTSANVDEADPQYPAGHSQTEGNDPTTVIALAGDNTTAGIDGYAPPVDLGIVKSVDNPTPLVGSQVVFTLIATNHGVGPATGVTVGDTLPTGYTFVSANPPAAYDSGTGVWTIGAMVKDATVSLTITATVNASGTYLNVASIDGDQTDPVPDNNTDNAETNPIQLGALTGMVWIDTDNDGFGDTAIEGVILSLTDGSGNPVLGGNGQPRTTTSASDGTYSFGSLPPGTYGVTEMQPAGYASLSDKDGDNPDEIRPITVTAGQTTIENDFVEMSRCPDTWADWKQLHPTEAPSGNPDADAYDNFAEFAFAMPYDSGVSGEHLADGTAWIIRPSNLDILEGVFVRPKGAHLNVTYTLQYKSNLGDPGAWQEIIITPAMIVSGEITAVDNGDCTETITILNLEGLPGLTGGKGVVRIKADLDDDGGNDEVDHTSFTEPEGWTETAFGLCCSTYNNPYQRESLFTGTVSSVNGQDLVFTGQTLDGLIAPGEACYVEVVSGDNEGHRFDVNASAGGSLTLALDSDIDAPSAPFNTLAGAPPPSLAGDMVILRRHWTLAERFMPSGFGATGNPDDADEVQLHVNGSWIVFWNYGIGGPPHWVRTGFGLADQGGTVIPPGWGMFFNNRTAATSLLAYGEVRTNGFRRPLSTGHNLVGGGYPVDQSPSGRAMIPGNTFFGSRDFKTADSILLWNKDADPFAAGYSTYYLLDNTPRLPAVRKWVKQTDVTQAPQDDELLMRGERSVFLRAKTAVPTYLMPTPWTP